MKRLETAENPDGKLPTLHDVAKAAQVSIATVSATIHGTARVSHELQARVREAIKALGYRPNLIAQSLKLGSTRAIGLIVTDITNPFFTSVVRSIEDIAHANSFALILCNSDENIQKERINLQLVRSRMVDGLIFSPVGAADEYADFAHNPTPTVLLDRTIDGQNLDAVTVDNAGGTYGAVRHLIALGHRRIAIVTGPEHLTTSRERLQGYRRALAEAGISMDEALVRGGGFRQQHAYDATLALLASRSPVTAIFASNNLMAIGVMLALKDIGLRCPEHVSVACFDDFDWANVFHPRLTTVAQPTNAIGQQVMNLLLGRMDHSASDYPSRQVVLQPELIVRDSCAPPSRKE